MTRSSLRRRIRAIETKRTPPAARVIGVLDTSEYATRPNMVQLSTPGGGGEYLTHDEWQRRYPHGTLIHIVYGELDE